MNGFSAYICTVVCAYFICKFSFENMSRKSYVSNSLSFIYIIIILLIPFLNVLFSFTALSVCAIDTWKISDKISKINLDDPVKTLFRLKREQDGT